MIPANVNHIIKDELNYDLLLMMPNHLAIMKLVLHCEEGESISIIRQGEVTRVIAQAADGRTNELALDITEPQIQQFILDDEEDSNVFISLSNQQVH
jgi:hypothetical protein